jgi:hypothetical protein
LSRNRSIGDCFDFGFWEIFFGEDEAEGVSPHLPNYFLPSSVTRRAGNYCSPRPVRSSVNQRVSVLEPHRISREHPGRTLLILIRVVSVEERVPKPILFGLPSCSLKRRTCLHALPSAPFNARGDGYGYGCRRHVSPPLLGRTSVDCTARPPRRPLNWLSSGTYLSRFRHTLVKAQRGCQGINTSCPMPGSLYVSSSCRGSILIPEEGWVRESTGRSIPPKTNCPARQDWRSRRGITGFRQKSRVGCSARMVRRVPT